MGYTHYWTQKRDFSAKEWETVTEDVCRILRYVEQVRGFHLGDAHGGRYTYPLISADRIWFNGIDRDAHETMCVERRRAPLNKDMKRLGMKRGWGFCKTARKPYDLAVTAVLTYLATVSKSHDVESDGEREDWTDGTELVRRALPHYADQVAIPILDREAA